jgi:hypothetical protein
MMAKFTNTAPGMRGLVMKSADPSGSKMKWLEAGETVDLNKTDIAKGHPDIVEGAKAAKEANEAE